MLMWSKSIVYFKVPLEVTYFMVNLITQNSTERSLKFVVSNKTSSK